MLIMGLIYPNASIALVKSTSRIDYKTITLDADGGVYPEVKVVFGQDGFKIRVRSIHNALTGSDPS